MCRHLLRPARALLLIALGGALILPANALASQVYVSNLGSKTVSPFSIGPGGALTPITCSECKTGTGPFEVAVSPNGQFLYTSNQGNTVSPFSIGPGGALSPITCPECNAGLSSPAFQSLAISPDQAPTAAFTDKPAAAGSASTFDGSISTASPGQSVARYDWSFGDGTSAQNAGTTPSHTYGAAGTYTVGLTVTDNAGCSTQLIFTGQTASCNGSSTAHTTRTMTIVNPPVNPPPSNAFTFGKLKLNKKKGTADLTVITPDPGNVLLFGASIKTENGATSGAQSYTLPVIPTGKTKKKLRRTGKVKVSVDVTFTPTDGAANTQAKKVTLRLKKKR